MKVTLLATQLAYWFTYGPGTLTKVYGTNAQATDRWLMFFTNPYATAGDVPTIKPLWFPSLVDTFYLDLKDLGLDQLYGMISTTAGVLTAPGAGTGLNISVEFDSNYIINHTTSKPTLAGDLTTGVAGLTIWSEASGPKKLRRLECINTSASDVYFFISAKDTITVTDSSMLGPFLCLANNGTINIFFGDGVSPKLISANALKQGGHVVASLSPLFGGAVIATTDFNIRATYE